MSLSPARRDLDEDDRLAVSVREAGRLIDKSEEAVRWLIHKRRIRVVKLGRSTLVPLSELRRLVEVA